ncbi:hypothetical protein BH10BDE1_BH10BDE1_13970 [soil metagenome]
MSYLTSVAQATLIAFHSFSGSWAVAIALLALLLKGILFPAQLFNYLQQKKLLRIRPELEAIAEKHKKDPLRIYQESASLKRRIGVKTAWTFITSLAPLPIFFSVYRVFAATPPLMTGGFAWITSFAAPDAFYILPLVVALAAFGQQTLFPASGVKPEMARVMRFMPVVSLIFMITLPSGLVLYYAVSGVLNLVADYAFRHFA